MTIDWGEFHPWSALEGGALIGLSAAAFIMLIGRIAGISGILGGLLRPERNEVAWRVAFIVGLLSAPWLASLFGQHATPKIDTSGLVLAISGLLVGYGTRLGAGCTSGHGVCGLSRLSLRSFVAVIVFMAAALITHQIVRLSAGGAL